MDENNSNISSEIAFLSDTQAPIWIETVFLKNRQNKKATQLIFNELLIKKPTALFILGDIVSLGFSRRQWKTIDPYLEQLRKNNIEVNAILGNHELMGRARAGEKKFQQRFPEHVRTGYHRIIDSTAIILLNSNFSRMTQAEIQVQNNWYENILPKLENDEQVKAIVVACHHSPYSNSLLVGSSVAVQKNFVPAFLKTKKGALFISGHSHAFEYFKSEKKNFLIIGGGGGLHHPLSKTKKLIDEAPEYKPLFHYITMRINGQNLEVISHQLNKTFTGFTNDFTLNIPLEAPVNTQ